MIDELGNWPLVFAALIVFAAFVQWRFTRSAQPLRIQLARQGKELLAREGISQEVRDHVKFLLATAFGFRWFLILAVIAIPAIAVVVVIAPSILKEAAKSFRIDGLEDRERHRALLQLHEKICFANHPFLMPAMILWGNIWISAAILLSALVRLAVPDVGRESARKAFELIEGRWARKLHAF